MSSEEDAPLMILSEGGDVRPNLYAALIIPYLAAVIAISLRFWSRRITETKYGWDDWLILQSFAVSTGEVAVFCYALHLGLGLPIGVVTERRSKDVFVAGFITELFYPLTMFLTRASALVLWMRLFHQREVRWYSWFWRTINVLWLIAIIITTCLQCHPTWVFWTPFTQKYSYFAVCKVNIRTFLIAVAASGIVMDLAIITLPLVLCWRLNLNRTTKVLVCGMFATGFFVTVISGIRLKVLLAFNLADITKALNTTWTYAFVVAWSVVEMNIGIVSACLPCLRPALAKLVPKTWVPKSLQRNAPGPLYTKQKLFKRGNGVQRKGSKQDALVSSERPDLEKYREASELASTGCSSSDRRDPVSDAESGIVEIAPGVLASRSWVRPSPRTGMSTEVHAGHHGQQSPRFDRIFVEQSIQVNSERNSLFSRQN